MEDRRGRAERKIAERNDSRIMPSLPLGILHHKHVIRKIFSKAELAGIRFFFRHRHFFHSDGLHRNLLLPSISLSHHRQLSVFVLR